MTNRRRVLLCAVSLIAVTGILIVAVTLSRSLAPTAAARRAQEVHVALRDIEADSLNPVSWRGRNVVILTDGTPRAFFLPYDQREGYYYLPDPTWDRPTVRCKQMHLAGDLLSCADPGFEGSSYAWHRDGRNVGTFISPLESPPYVIDDGTLIVGREHER